ncbi:MAG: hypothetical protein NT116_00100, partial [Candidatus Parcubacteria bacterium]|nr:hypothetical protein [Candidatus Parcubacteria bacterium]
NPELLLADKDGWVIQNGEKYASLNVIAGELNLSVYHLRMRARNVSYYLGKPIFGTITKFYSLNQLKTACADLLNPELIVLDKDGWAIKDGNRYAPIDIIAKELKLGKKTILDRLKNSLPLKGSNRHGRISNFYNFNQAKKACADLLNPELLIAGEDGWAFKNGERYAPKSIIAKKLHLSTDAVARRIKDLTPLPGRAANNLIKDYYCFMDVISACSALLDKKRRQRHDPD